MDTESRQLQRTFESTQALPDEMAWLQALVREGALDDERLKFAAMLGNEACLELTGLERLDPANQRARFDLAVAYGDDMGDDLQVLAEDALRPAIALRCAAAAGREFLPDHSRRTDDLRTTVGMLTALDAMALCGRTRTLDAFEREASPREERGREAMIQAWLRGGRKKRTELDGLYAAIVGFAFGGNGCMFGMLGVSSGAPMHVSGGASYGISKVALEPHDALRPWQATQREVLPWLLGRGDPVLERMLQRSPYEKNVRPKPCAVQAEALRLGGRGTWEPAVLRGASPSHLVIEPLPSHPAEDEPLALAFPTTGFPRPVCAITRVTSRRVEDRPAHQLLWTEPAAWRYLGMWAKAKTKRL